MNCICGCGQRLAAKQSDLNLLAGEVAIELVVWDKARALRSPVAAAEIGAILSEGAPRYQLLLATIHAGDDLGRLEREAIGEWLADSRSARKRLGGELPVVPKKKISLSKEDQARIDRVHPERTFSGHSWEAPAEAPAEVETEMPPAGAGAPDPELDALIAAADGDDYERLAVAWLGRLIATSSPSLDELRWLLGRLEDLRSGRRDEAEPALRRFLAERG
ncbi:MAG: hypothetical protein JST31_01630 [Actinobacteria bacterium]|nr:hypothetical protein [Actinomycetota bacterium]